MRIVIISTYYSHKTNPPNFITTAKYLLITITLIFILGDLQTITEGDILQFDGNRAYQDVLYQVTLGARIPGSQAHFQTIEWLISSLNKQDWDVEVQESKRMNHPIENIIAKRGQGFPWIIIGAHYDTRMLADRDVNPSKRNLPVIGANDGASGVAILTELSRILPKQLNKRIWLVFFDAEDNGNINGWDWILGSRAFVDSLEDEPSAVVIVDMVGDKKLNLYYENNSDPRISAEIWQIAADLGYSDVFIPEQKYNIFDDHIPFIEKNIPAIDIIDFDYPDWHQTTDTLDKVSALSLQIVGNTLFQWLLDT